MADQKLSAEELQALSPEELQELVIQNQDAYDKLKSDSSKWANKVLDEKKLLEKVVATVIKDKEGLSAIYEADPELANTLSNKLFNEDYQPKEEDDVDTIVEKKLQQRDVQSKVEHVKQQIPEQYREAFDKEFAELTEWKTLSSETVDKFIKSAVALSIPDDRDDADAVKAMAIWSSIWGSATKSSSTKTSKAVEYSTQLLKDQGIL